MTLKQLIFHYQKLILSQKLPDYRAFNIREGIEIKIRIECYKKFIEHIEDMILEESEKNGGDNI